ncbi:MAG: acyltransferase family protein [Candidatus Binataceae bacterium]
MTDPLWSVSVEEQFYLSWPLVARYLSRRGVAVTGALVWVLSIASRWVFIREGFSPAVIELGTLSRLDPIACGLLLSAFLGGSTRPLSKISRRRLIIIGAYLWLFGAGCLFRSDDPAPRDFMFAFPAVALGCGAFLLATIGAGSWMLNPPLTYLGRISYGLYVYHGAVILGTVAIFAAYPGWLKWLLCPAISLTATIGIAALSYRWLERPFLRLKVRFQYVHSAAPAL